jgi:glutamate racemase
LRSIGVFDSGIGGLTVVKELLECVPHERIVYFGDTARVPYGSKSVETVQRYSREDTELLLAHDVKLIVIACNTVSAVALEAVKETAQGIPVIGMIEPCVREAARSTKNNRIGIIGTEATVASKAYERGLIEEGRTLGKVIEVFSQACPLFVPLAEEGWTDHEATRLVAEEYLRGLKEEQVDTLILGCTHYPILTSIIQRVMGDNVRLINSGAVAAQEVRHFIDGRSSKTAVTDHLVLVSDVPRKFQQVGERFLGRAIPVAKQVQWKEAWVITRQAI